MLKTSAFGLGFQHLPRNLANVNAWKTMFDPYIEKYERKEVLSELADVANAFWRKSVTSFNQINIVSSQSSSEIASKGIAWKHLPRRSSALTW